MSRLLKSMALLAAVVAHPLLAAATPHTGTYVRESSNKAHSGVLNVVAASAEQATLSLAVEYNPSPTGDGFYTRSAELQNETVPVSGSVAVYRAPPEEPSKCLVVFVFSTSQQAVEISQFGECSWFGVGVNASGRYVRKAKAPSK